MTAVVIMLGGFPDLRYRMTPDVKRKARACERDLEVTNQRGTFAGTRLYAILARKAPTWTAISRPPFLTALTFWPKGDAWGGGGLFENERTIHLNHRATEMQLADNWKLPKSLRVEPLGNYSGRGEDDPIWTTRLLRDDWVLKQPGKVKRNKLGSPLWVQFVDPMIWRKSQGDWTIEMRLQGLHEREGPWYVMEHQLTDGGGNIVCSMGRSDWADWSRSGEVLFARSGRLYRISVDSKRASGEPEELIDLRKLAFEPIEAPQDAKVWSGRGPRGRILKGR